MTNIIKDDEVIVIAGNHRGSVGKVLNVDGKKILIQGVNICKKHMKPTQDSPKGQILQIERPINISNVKPYVEGKAVKLRAKSEKDGSKVLYYRDGAKDVVHRTLKKAK